MVRPSQPRSAICLLQLGAVELGVAAGELLALLGGAALAPAEVADRGDEVALLVGELEVHGGGAYPVDGFAIRSRPQAVAPHKSLRALLPTERPGGRLARSRLGS